MSKVEKLVRDFLAAAKAFLAPGFFMVFPGGARFDSLENLGYCFGTLYGELLDGTPYSGVRFIDRFTVCDGKLVDQMVWNDLPEARGPGKPA